MTNLKSCKSKQHLNSVESKYRRICTKIPVPQSLAIFRELEKYEARSMHGQLPVVWDRAKDFQVFDKWGNCWIDFTSTIFVANSGHANLKIISAIRKQLDKNLIHTYTFAHETRVKFLKKLIQMMPNRLEKAFLLSAGTEATECAVKLMRMYGQTVNASKVTIISFQGAMHGRTMGAEMLKGNAKTSAWIGYTDPNIYHLRIPFPWNENGTIRNSCDWAGLFESNMQEFKANGLDFNNIAGFIIESYVGWAAYFYPVEYIKRLFAFAKEYKSLITFDDIQGGIGRTGKLLACQHYGISPDIVCLGKGISSSLPLSAVVGKREIMDLPEIGSMSSTHSANPLSCAAGLANLEVIESENLIRESARKGRILHSRLNEIKLKYPNRISYIFGNGLLVAIIFKDMKTGKPDAQFPTAVCKKAMRKGLLLVYTGRESIKIGPPLTIPDSALEEGLSVLDECICEVDSES